jgi:N4-gp56 family major capsid protein
MPTVVTTTTSIAPEVRVAYERTLLKAARPNLVYHQFFDPHPIPKHMGKTILLRRWELLTAMTTPLVEGVTPTGSSLTVTPVSIAVNQYGDFVALSDMVIWTSIDNMVTGTVDIQGQQAGNTLDQLSRAVATSGATVRYANGRTSRATVAAGDIFNDVETKKAVRTLENNNAKPRAGGDWVAVCHPNVSYDLTNSANWINPRYYSNPTDLFNNEIGTLWGVRFMKTTNAVIFAGAGAAGIDVYGTMIFGINCLGATEISGEALETIMQPLGAVGFDPLKQRQYIGWKATWGGAVQNDLFMVRVESSVSS